MLAEHLEVHGLSFTLSVFRPESGLGTSPLLPAADMAQLLNLGPGTRLGASLRRRLDAGVLNDKCCVAVVGHKPVR
jgi:hypothetical protein